MAYQVRSRDPFFASDTQELIERRGREMIGLAFLAVGIALAMLLVSYSPEDPGWLAATDGPVHNYLGRVGAAIASPMMVIIGLASWGFSIALVVWGIRFVSHKGAGRLLGRAFLVPIAIAIATVYTSTLLPGPRWTHSFGMGGLFGDTIAGAVLGLSPFSMIVSLKVLSVVSGLATLAVGLFALGFDAGELRRVGRFLMVGVVMIYALFASLLGLGARKAASGAAQAAKGAVRGAVRGAAHGAMGAARSAARIRLRQSADAPVEVHPDLAEEFPAPPPLAAGRVLRADPLPDELVEEYADDPVDGYPEEPPVRMGLFARMPGLRKRYAVPRADPVEPMPDLAEIPDDLPEEDRIRAKISLALKNRMRQAAKGAARRRAEPPLVASAAEPGHDLDPMAQGADEYPATAYDPGPDAPMMPEPAPAMAPRPRAPAPAPRKVVQHPPRKPAPTSARARSEAQPTLQFDDSAQDYELPPLSLLTDPNSVQRHHLSDQALEENARMLETVLDDYGIKGEIVSVRPGPVVTQYELEPAPGLKASRVIGLADDIARSMSALSARVSTVPGRSVIGIELPNDKREMVVLREILSTRDFDNQNMQLPLALGKDIGGDPIVANLAKMPHLLIAGTTGSGKSVAINTMILSLLYRLTPEECRLIMIDPKMLELSVYDGIPHLLSPVVTDPKKAVVALKWVVGEMEERYRKMSKMGVRNIEGYNSKVRDTLARGEQFTRTVQTGFDDDTGEPIFETEEFTPETLPFIVVIVDEMADLMMVAGKEIEACIQRLAQMARASGIHLIMATQRPSVDVITGTIKANFPTRISFQVTSKIDSRTILGEQGAEQLLGMGDMLYMAGGARITRVHGPFVSDEEVEEIVNHLKSYGAPEYVSGVVEGPDDEKSSDIDLVLGLGGNTNGEDALYDQAVAVVLRDRKVSTSYIQRKLSIGYNKAAKLVERMEEEGLVSASNHVGKREILVPEGTQM